MIRGPHTKLVLGKNADERFIDRPFAAFQSRKVHLEVPRQELVGADPLGIAVVVIPFGKMKILHIFFRPEQAVHPTQIGKLDCWCVARLILTPSVYGDRGTFVGVIPGSLFQQGPPGDGDKELEAWRGQCGEVCVVRLMIFADVNRKTAFAVAPAEEVGGYHHHRNRYTLVHRRQEERLCTPTRRTRDPDSAVVNLR